MDLLNGLQRLRADDELGFSLSDVGKALGSVAKIAAAPITLPAKAIGGAIGGDVGRAISTAADFANPVTMLAKGAGMAGGGAPAVATRPPPLPAAPVPAAPTAADLERAEALKRLAAAKPADMTQEEYVASLRALQAAKPAGMTNEQFAAALRPIAQARPEGMSQAEYGALLREAQAAKARGVSHDDFRAQWLAEQQAASGRPRISARSVRSTDDGGGDVTRGVEAALLPKIAEIQKLLSQASLQRQATYEHDVLTNETAYRKKVLGDLMRLAQTLPDGHPVRRRIMKVGILSGFI